MGVTTRSKQTTGLAELLQETPREREGVMTAKSSQMMMSPLAAVAYVLDDQAVATHCATPDNAVNYDLVGEWVEARMAAFLPQEKEAEAAAAPTAASPAEVIKPEEAAPAAEQKEENPPPAPIAEDEAESAEVPVPVAPPPSGRIGPKDVVMTEVRGSVENINGAILCRHVLLFSTLFIVFPFAISPFQRANFSSVRANVAVFKGRWMYEVQLGSSGILQIGWTPPNARFTTEEGIGDSSFSYAYDGKRQRKWNVTSTKYGDRWAAGDVISVGIDMDAGTISYWQNGKALGVAFENIKRRIANGAYLPGISLSYAERCEVNFGNWPFMYPQEGYAPLQAPPAEELMEQAEYVSGSWRRLLDVTVKQPVGADSPRAAAALAAARATFTTSHGVGYGGAVVGGGGGGGEEERGDEMEEGGTTPRGAVGMPIDENTLEQQQENPESKAPLSNVDALLLASTLAPFTGKLCRSPYFVNAYMLPLLNDTLLGEEEEEKTAFPRLLGLLCSILEPAELNALVSATCCALSRIIRGSVFQKEKLPESSALSALQLWTHCLRHPSWAAAWTSHSRWTAELEGLLVVRQPAHADLEEIMPSLLWDESDDVTEMLGRCKTEGQLAEDVKDLGVACQLLNETQAEIFAALCCVPVNRGKAIVENPDVQGAAREMKRASAAGRAPMGPPPALQIFIKYLIKKNAGATRNIPPPGLSPGSVLVSTFFALLRQLQQWLERIHIRGEPFKFIAAPFYTGMGLSRYTEVPRFGGLFSHLKKEFPVDKKQIHSRIPVPAAEPRRPWVADWPHVEMELPEIFPVDTGGGAGGDGGVYGRFWEISDWRFIPITKSKQKGGMEIIEPSTGGASGDGEAGEGTLGGGNAATTAAPGATTTTTITTTITTADAAVASTSAAAPAPAVTTTTITTTTAAAPPTAPSSSSSSSSELLTWDWWLIHHCITLYALGVAPRVRYGFTHNDTLEQTLRSLRAMTERRDRDEREAEEGGGGGHGPLEILELSIEEAKSTVRNTQRQHGWEHAWIMQGWQQEGTLAMAAVIGRLLMAIQDVEGPLLAYVQDLYLESALDMMHSARRFETRFWGPIEAVDAFGMNTVIAAAIRLSDDARIVSPEPRSIMLVSLCDNLSCYECLGPISSNPVAAQKLLPLLIHVLREERNWVQAANAFGLFLVSTGFGHALQHPLLPTWHDDNWAEVEQDTRTANEHRRIIRSWLAPALRADAALSAAFFNALFDRINWIITELISVVEEINGLGDQQRDSSLQRRCIATADLCLVLLRLQELACATFPEQILGRGKALNATRLAEILAFGLRQFTPGGKIDQGIKKRGSRPTRDRVSDRKIRTTLSIELLSAYLGAIYSLQMDEDEARVAALPSTPLLAHRSLVPALIQQQVTGEVVEKASEAVEKHLDADTTTATAALTGKFKDISESEFRRVLPRYRQYEVLPEDQHAVLTRVTDALSVAAAHYNDGVGDDGGGGGGADGAAEDEPPHEFLDPIMQTIMEDPIILPHSGILVDRSTIERHLLSSATDPFSREPLALEDLKEDAALKARIDAWLAGDRSAVTLGTSLIAEEGEERKEKEESGAQAAVVVVVDAAADVVVPVEAAAVPAEEVVGMVPVSGSEEVAAMETGEAVGGGDGDDGVGGVVGDEDGGDDGAADPMDMDD